MTIFGSKWGGKVDPRKRVSPVVSGVPFVSAPKQSATFVQDTGTAKSRQQYTGTQMLGIATMHKSNSVPVFNSQAAVELAQMRRN